MEMSNYKHNPEYSLLCLCRDYIEIYIKYIKRQKGDFIVKSTTFLTGVFIYIAYKVEILDNKFYLEISKTSSYSIRYVYFENPSTNGKNLEIKFYDKNQIDDQIASFIQVFSANIPPFSQRKSTNC